jgi:phenylalanyl-tRNA synthetase alpha subunit
MLYRLAQAHTFQPQKYFSIDRVFRNETLDATHLAEFHQASVFRGVRGLLLLRLDTRDETLNAINLAEFYQASV